MERHRRIMRQGGRKRGSMMIEVIAALGIFAYVMPIIAMTINTALIAVRQSQEVTVASQVTSGLIQQSRATPWAELGFTTQDVATAQLDRTEIAAEIGGPIPPIPDLTSSSVANVPIPSPAPPDALVCPSGSTTGLSCNRPMPFQSTRVNNINFVSVVTIRWISTHTPLEAANYGVKEISVRTYWGPNFSKSNTQTITRTATPSEAVPVPITAVN